MVDRARRLQTTITFWSIAIGFPIDWVLVRSSLAFKRSCDAGRAQACYMLAGMHMKELAGLHNSGADVLPKLDMACASKFKDSCELAKVYREGMAGAGSGSASP